MNATISILLPNVTLNPLKLFGTRKPTSLSSAIASNKVRRRVAMVMPSSNKSSSLNSNRWAPLIPYKLLAIIIEYNISLTSFKTSSLTVSLANGAIEDTQSETSCVSH